jgi:uncharacterized DUF497 family protein
MQEAILPNIIGFDWDAANQHKNWHKHQVSSAECEEIFFNIPLLLHEDTAHSINEKRMLALGQTDNGRRLFIAFTTRKQRIRIISARDMHKKERAIYEKT